MTTSPSHDPAARAELMDALYALQIDLRLLTDRLATDRALSLSGYALRHIEHFRAFLTYSVPSLRRH